MAIMTPEEIKQKVPKGYYVKEKCDNCDMPIMSSLVYRGSKGSYCSNPCYEEAELDGDNRARRRKRTSKKGRARATDITKESDTMIKGGSKDIIVYSPEGDFLVSPFKIKVVDGVGAGDAFDTGFLTALLTGKDLADAVVYGSACGSLKCTREGAQSAPNKLELEDFLKENSDKVKVTKLLL